MLRTLNEETRLAFILDLLKAQTIKYNAHNEKYWGVIFHRKENGSVSAMFITAFHFFEVENVNIKTPKVFFNYTFNEWTDYPFKEGINEVQNILSKKVELFSDIVLPCPNLVNFLERLDKEGMQKSRVVFTPGFIEDGQILLNFKSVGGVIEHRPRANPDVSYVPAWNSKVHTSSIKLDTQVYKCVVVGNPNPGVFLVDVLEPFGKVRIGIKHSSAGFIPDRIRELNYALEDIPAELILTVNDSRINNEIAPLVIPPESVVMTDLEILPHAFKPVHVDCELLYNIVKSFGKSKNPFIRIMFGPTSDHPVQISSIVNSLDEDIAMTTVFAPLNQRYGAQRR